MLEIKNVYKNYRNLNVLSDVSLTIKKGEVISIIGKSGCGKSTLLKCLNRLEEIDAGQILLEGEDITKIPLVELRQKIGIVFQDYNLFEHLTVLENLIIGPNKIKKIPRSECNKMAISILRKVGLEDKKDNYPDELSGGQKQRVAIARTLIMKPQIIMLDEPISALDKEMKAEVLNLIYELVKENMTLIIVSHEDDFVNKISDKIISIKRGKFHFEKKA